MRADTHRPRRLKTCPLVLLSERYGSMPFELSIASLWQLSFVFQYSSPLSSSQSLLPHSSALLPLAPAHLPPPPSPCRTHMPHLISLTSSGVDKRSSLWYNFTTARQSSFSLPLHSFPPICHYTPIDTLIVISENTTRFHEAHPGRSCRARLRRPRLRGSCA
jgi:hypothetical protein